MKRQGASAQRGDLNPSPPTDVTNKQFAQQWKTDQAAGLDPTGNWTDFWQDDNGDATWDLKQQRDHNHVNEIDVDDNHRNAAGASITATTGTNWADPVHDAAGNMTTVPNPASLANGLTLKYDAWNRLVEVKEGENVIARYEFDGLNRQTIEAPTYAPTTYYMHKFWNSSWQMLELRSTTTQNAQPESLGATFQYVWSARYIDAPVLRDYAGTRYYYLGDANFNVTTLVDTGGDAVERYLYGPYGRPTIYDGTWTNTRSTSSYDNTILYTGREYDPETGLYHYRERYYHAELGRFVSRDPITADINPYRYCGNRPTYARDPSGTAPKAEAGAVVCDPRKVGAPPLEKEISQRFSPPIQRCIQRHEDLHKRHLMDANHEEGKCCRKLQEEWQRRQGDRDAQTRLLRAYNKWLGDNVAVEECDAYQVDMQCAWDEGKKYDCPNMFKGGSKKPDIDTMPPTEYLRCKYCWDLYDYWKNALRHKAQYCSDAKPYTPCPDFGSL